jgi:hypothetical protein
MPSGWRLGRRRLRWMGFVTRYVGVESVGGVSHGPFPRLPLAHRPRCPEGSARSASRPTAASGGRSGQGGNPRAGLAGRRGRRRRLCADDEGEQQADGEGGDDDEVDGDERAGVCREEGAPRGRRARRRPGHVLGDGQLGDRVAEQGRVPPYTPSGPQESNSLLSREECGWKAEAATS